MKNEIKTCRVCKARGITTVLVIEPHGDKVRTAHHCHCCGEELAVVWSKRKKEGSYGARGYQGNI